jgi:hypothetical protein
MTDDMDDELAELREQTSRGNRLDEQADEGDFVDRIVTMLDAVDEGDRSKVLSLYDPQLAALIYALEDDPQRFREVVEALGEAQGTNVDVEEIGRTEFLKMAVRVGLRESAPDLLDEAKEAVTRRTEF